MMDIFEKLGTVATQQNEEGEFPTWLLSEVMVIANNPDRYADKLFLIETLTLQISNFDPYAGAGCFDISVGAETIRKTICQIVT